ncbi:MAG: tetratricopeptide repeat protein [Gammaproteobacteria bacterium]
MIRYLERRSWQWWLPLLAGTALLAAMLAAHADLLPPGIQVIHIHKPAYLERPPGSGPFSMADIKDALELAKLGDAQAQANLGIMLQSRGEYKKAAYWYLQAANSGIANAQYNMGTLYFNGEGFPKDYTKALQWFRQAAQRDNEYAEFQLALMHSTGQGVAKDPQREIYWYKRAASQGLAPAAYNLGVIYANGVEIPADYVQAYAWMQVALNGGLDAAGPLSEIASSMTPAQIQQAKVLSKTLAPAVAAASQK